MVRTASLDWSWESLDMIEDARIGSFPGVEIVVAPLALPFES